METLINLLNEFDSGIVWLTEDLLRETGCTYCIICKPYGFIKRLVDNDKIDFDKIIEKSEYLIEYRWNKIDQNMIENTLLMLLSISDSPIEDLISYLK